MKKRKRIEDLERQVSLLFKLVEDNGMKIHDMATRLDMLRRFGTQGAPFDLEKAGFPSGPLPWYEEKPFKIT